MSLRIDTAFDGGNLGTVREVTAGRVVAAIHRDHDELDHCSQATWYYARFDGCKARPFEVVLTDLGGVYNGRPGHSIDERDAARVSDDGVHWRTVYPVFDRDACTWTIPVDPVGDSVWVAHLEPCVDADLRRLHAELAPAFRTASLGPTVEGRPLPFWTLGDDSAPHAVWLMARQHAWETHTNWCLEGALRWLASPAAEALRRRCVFKILPLMDPDGVVHGKTRFNTHGYDLNRHWNATDPADPDLRRLRPEICAAKGAVTDWLAVGRPIDLFINLHDTQLDYLDAPAGCDGPLLLGFHKHLCAAGFSGPYRRGDGGHPGVIQTAMWEELGVVGCLIELGTACLPTYGRHPTSTDRVRFGADLARALDQLIGR
ncbi:MAG: hypothetical protein HYU66_16100 [Armatimonadetes bacterium]|nr:hypothetical protein [Armatimonadota bacterium]